MAEDPFILCENLVKIYKVANLEVVALQGLDLSVRRGELLGIVGASGSGKSTLMNILGGLDRPSAGRVLVGGRDLRKIPDAALDHYRRSTVGFVWQQSSRNLVPYLTAQENVELPMTFMGELPGRKRKRAVELLQAVGLAHRRRHRLSQMSGGEQQRVAIAVSLANNPTLLLADEPTGEVDSMTAQTIYQAIRDLNKLYNLTTLIVSHDQTIAHHVDRVVAIRDGKTASETIRHMAAQPATETPAGEEGIEEALPTFHFQELVVLDSAGRLQVPKEFLEEFGIGNRAQLERTADGILIRAVQQAAAATSDVARPLAEQATASGAATPAAARRRGLFGLLRGRRRPGEEER